jgi:hypothetical protein
MKSRSPDFIGIGAQKAGTCWLRSALGQHPGVWMPAVGEVHYFDQPLDGNGVQPTAATDEWYRSLFALSPESSVIGEITPRYAICGEAEISHMHSMASNRPWIKSSSHPQIWR